jgi:hypothetical protein
MARASPGVQAIVEREEIENQRVPVWSPTGTARGTSMFFGGIRRSVPSYAQGFGGLSSSHSSTAIGRCLLRRRINYASSRPYENQIETFKVIQKQRIDSRYRAFHLALITLIYLGKLMISE